MSKAKQSKKAVTGRAECTVEEGKKALSVYFSKLPKLPSEEKARDGKPGGYKSEDEFLFAYLVPMGLRRLAALDRYNAKQK